MSDLYAPTDVKSAINFYADLLAEKLLPPCDRLEAVKRALIIALESTGVRTGETVYVETETFGDLISVNRVYRIAEKLSEDQGRFTLDELLEELCPDGVGAVRTFKNGIARLLRAAGYHPRQVRRNGKRPIIWERFTGAE